MSLWSAFSPLFERRKVVKMSREQLEARNLAKFRELAAFVKRRSPYYARIIEERGIDPAQAVVQDFPVLSKELLMEHFDEISTDPRIRKAPIEKFLAAHRNPRKLMHGRYRVIHGSGTSGRVCYIAYTKAEWMRGVVQFERIVRSGFRKKIAFVGAIHGHFAAASMAVPAGLARLSYRVKMFDVNLPMDEIVAGVQRYKPRILAGYGRVLRGLAEAQQAGRLDIAPAVVINGGEALSGTDRRFIRDAFNKVHVRDAYATTEHLYMAFDLYIPPGFYLIEDELIFEPQEDRTLVTNLFNRTVPLIRHRMDDVFTPAPETEWHNPPYRTIGRIVGRFEHAPVFLNETGEKDSINPHVLGEFQVPGLKQFQFRIVDATSFRFMAVLDKDTNGEVAQGIRDGLAALLTRKRMRNVQFEVELVDHLPHDPKTGKFRLIVRPEDDQSRG